MVKYNTVGIAKLSDELKERYQSYPIDEVEKVITESLSNIGLKGTKEESSLSSLIKPGMVVLLKPNLVLHYNQSGGDTIPLITHRNFIGAVIMLVSKCNPSKIIIGDAPIQGCQLEKIWTIEYKKFICSLTTIPIEFVDFRRTILKDSDGDGDLGKGVSTNLKSLDRYILYDLKEKSYLEEISVKEGIFRVAMYDHQLLARNHKRGTHKYLIAKEPFEADVVINLPKMKTHKKAGITVALKNLVGINGNKDYLPHHRVGGSEIGGDNYEGFSRVKRLIEFLLDKSNENINKRKYHFYNLISRMLIKTNSLTGGSNQLDGGWYGNDTVWRTVLDLNSILKYGKIDGSICEEKQREVLNITDAIIAGEGEGPLDVKPVNLGMVICSFSAIYNDLVCAYLMNYDWQKIPLIKYSLCNELDNMTDDKLENILINFKNKRISIQELQSKLSYPFIPASGWKNHIEINVSK